MRDIFVNIFAYILIHLPTHKSRKKFAKFFGPFFDGYAAKTVHGFYFISRWYDNTNRICFEGSDKIVMEFIKQIPGKSLFIDIGANQGCTAIMASKVLEKKGGGGVLAYESSPMIYELLQKNISINKCMNIELLNSAVSKEKKPLKLSANDSFHTGSSHVSSEGIEINSGPIKYSDIRDIDNYDKLYIKIDTEGYEMEVLLGIQELVNSHMIQQICIEIDEENLKRYDYTPKEIYEYLNQNGFSPRFGLSTGHYDEIFTKL